MIEHLRAWAIPASYTLLPIEMASDAATAMLLAIALQESKGEYRRQISGPARGFWQFEWSGVFNTLTHYQTRKPLEKALATLRYVPDPEVCVRAIEHNDVLAAAFARCLLWSYPEPLPSRDEPDDGWRQYLETWRPGKPHYATWRSHYARAWALTVPDAAQG